MNRNAWNGCGERTKCPFWKFTDIPKKWPWNCVGNTDFCPLFINSPRGGGCWFCPNQRISEMAHLKEHRPDLWAELLRLDEVPGRVTKGFKYDETFQQRARRVEQWIRNRDLTEQQLNLFEPIWTERSEQT